MTPMLSAWCAAEVLPLKVQPARSGLKSFAIGFVLCAQPMLSAECHTRGIKFDCAQHTVSVLPLAKTCWTYRSGFLAEIDIRR